MTEAPDHASIRLLIDLDETIGERRTGAKRFWTTRELQVLRTPYPAEGLEGAFPKLPGRSRQAIYLKAGLLGLQSPRSARGASRRRYTTNDGLDAVIRRAYESPERSAIKRLAALTDRPRHWLNCQAKRLGCTVPRFKEPNWTGAEDEIVTENASRSPAVIQRRLARHGFKRTEIAIIIRLKRLDASTEDPDHYTASGLAKLFGVAIKVVTGWISKGWLVASRRGTKRTEAQGGDQWWIHRRAVRAFIIGNAAAVDMRKVDKFWFIELLGRSTSQ